MSCKEIVNNTIYIFQPQTAASVRTLRGKRAKSALKQGVATSEPSVPITVISLEEKDHQSATTTSMTLYTIFCLCNQILVVLCVADQAGEKEHAQYGGLVEALAKPNAAAMEVEVSGQDKEAVSSLERELNEESIMVCEI